MQNRPSRRSVRGVFHRSGRTMFVRLSVNGRRLFGGSFKSEVAAAVRYNELARYFHGEFATLNSPATIATLALKAYAAAQEKAR